MCVGGGGGGGSKTVKATSTKLGTSTNKTNAN